MEIADRNIAENLGEHEMKTDKQLIAPTLTTLSEVLLLQFFLRNVTGFMSQNEASVEEKMHEANNR